MSSAILAVVVLLLAASSGRGAPVREIAPGRLSLSVSGVACELPCYASHDLVQSDSTVTRILVVLHDSSRSAANAFSAAMSASRAAGASAVGTLVVAPQFLTREDATTFGVADAVLRWAPLPGGADWEQGWDQGNASDGIPGGISSFAALDALLARLSAAELFPRLREIVVAGLSLGAQFVNRYAAGSPTPEALRALRGIVVRYVVAGPSSYLYFDTLRPMAGTSDAFGVPAADVQRTCAGWNSYRYGLEGLNPYMTAVGAAGLRSRYAAQTVTYLVGSDDRGGEQSCAARLQGADRRGRAQAYYAYLRHTFGSAIAGRHVLLVAPNIGHSWDLLSTPCGRSALFGGSATQACGL